MKMMLFSILKGIFYTDWKAAPCNSPLDSCLIHFSSGFSAISRFKKKGFLTFCQFFHLCLYSHFISHFLSSLQQPLLWQDKATHKKSFHGYFTLVSIFEREAELKQHDSLIHFFSLSATGLTGLGYRQTHCHLQFGCPTGMYIQNEGSEKIPAQADTKTYLTYTPDEDSYHLLWRWCLQDSLCTAEEGSCGMLRSVKAWLAVVAYMPDFLSGLLPSTYLSSSTTF